MFTFLSHHTLFHLSILGLLHQRKELCADRKHDWSPWALFLLFLSYPHLRDSLLVLSGGPQGTTMHIAGGDLAPGRILPANSRPQQHRSWLSVMGPQRAGCKAVKPVRPLLRITQECACKMWTSLLGSHRHHEAHPHISRCPQIWGLKPWLTEPAYRGMARVSLPPYNFGNLASPTLST